MPTFFGAPVIMSPLIAVTLTDGDHQGFYIKRGAVAIAMQQDIRVQSQYSLQHLATQLVADAIYGVKRMDTNKTMGVALLDPS